MISFYFYSVELRYRNMLGGICYFVTPSDFWMDLLTLFCCCFMLSSPFLFPAYQFDRLSISFQYTPNIADGPFLFFARIFSGAGNFWLFLNASILRPLAKFPFPSFSTLSSFSVVLSVYILLSYFDKTVSYPPYLIVRRRLSFCICSSIFHISYYCFFCFLWFRTPILSSSFFPPPPYM